MAARTVRTVVLSLAAATLTAAPPAQAQQAKAIFTASEAGAYHSKFCPEIPAALEKAGFGGYVCTPTGGTPDNIDRILKDPRSLGFAQLDILARWTLDHADAARKIVVVRTLACEGLWMVARNKDMSTIRFGQIVGNARRLRFAVADGGSRASFEFMQKIDPEGLGRARNVEIVKNATEVIDFVATSGADVGFFVQFIEPSNPNIRLVHERRLHTVPVVNAQLVAAKVADNPVYHVQIFTLIEGSSVGGGSRLTTTCTPAVVITGAPEQIADASEARNHLALVDKIKAAPDTVFLATYERWARKISGNRNVTPAALKEMLAAYEVAKRKAEAR